MSDDDDERPTHRSARFTIPVDPVVLEQAEKRAGGSARLRGIFRVLMGLFADGEMPEPHEDLIAQSMRRAQKTPRKKAKKRKETK